MPASYTVRRPMVWVVLILLACGFALAGEFFQKEPAPSAVPAQQEQLLSTGKKLFVERCGRCHDERGNKPLASGPPLSERKLSREVIIRAVGGRLKDRTDDERAAVVAYIESFLRKKPEIAEQE